MSDQSPPSLTLYSTAGCHLCEQAEALLRELTASEPLHWRVVDIATDDALIDRYGVRIPVLQAEGCKDDLGWPFNADAVRHYLRLADRLPPD